MLFLTCILSNADNQLKQAIQHVEALGKEILGLSSKATLQQGFAMIPSQEVFPSAQCIKLNYKRV
jgi:hypothetical protein